MGISNRMKLKNAAILADTQAAINTPKASDVNAPRSASGGPLTAPGGLAIFRQEMLNRDADVKTLEAELAQFRAGIRTVKLSTDLIAPSKWANRHQTSFESKAFEDFKEEIAHAGGNIQPILVRPSPSQKDRFEVVFGHRRFAACRDLGIEVLAMVMDLTDEELFTLMDRENRQRADLTPYEQGVMWAKALDAGLFTTARKLAAHLGVSHTLVYNCMDIAGLPDYVLEVFVRPTELQHRWVKPIKDLMQSDPELLVERAQKILALGKPLPSAKAFEMLTRTQTDEPKAPTISLRRGGKVIGKMCHGADGEVTLSIRPGVISHEAFAKLQEQVETLIGK